MAKKLTEDELKWILSVDATKAQQEVRALSKDNSKLNTTNKELKDRMIDLIATGKKESEEFNRLSKEVERNNEKIDKNKAKIKALEGTMGISALTMAQLRKQAKDLQRQLDNTSQATHPEEWNQLNQNLLEVRSRIDELKASGKKTEETLGDTITSSGKIATFLGNMYTKAAEWAMEALSKAKEFVAEGIKMAGMAQGVERAFNRISTPGMLNELRQSTKGMVNDLQLMQSAVKAHNFKIPLEELGTLLRFAQQRAQETGESVDYLTESIVTGIGRQSPLILDNLGISAKRLSDEVAKTGDFAKAVGKIVREELSKSGETIDTAADKAQQRAVLLQNIQMSIGQRMIGIVNSAGSAWTSFLDVINRWVSIPTVEKLRDEQRETNILARSIMAAEGRTESRNLLIQEMQRQYPSFLANLDMEKLTNEQLAERLREVNGEYENRLRVQVMNDKILSPLQEKQRNLIEEEMNGITGLNEMVELYGKYMTGSFKEAIKSGDILKMSTKEIDEQLVIMRQRGAAGGLTVGIDKIVKRLKDIPDELKTVDTQIQTTIEKVSSFGKPKQTQTGLLQPMSQEISMIEHLKALRKQAADEMKESTEKEIRAKNQVLKYYDDEIARLNSLGIEKEKKEKKEKKINSLDTLRKQDKDKLNLLRNSYDQELSVINSSEKQKKIVLEKSLVEENISQQEYNLLKLSLEAANAEKRLEIERAYLEDVANIELETGEGKAQAVMEANQKVLEADLKAAQTRAAQQKELQKSTSAVSDFKDKFNVLTSEEETKLQLDALKAGYEAAKELAAGNTTALSELDAAYERAKTQLLQQEEDKRNQIRSQYDLLSMQEQYEVEQEQLKQQYDQGLLDEEEYQKAKNQIKVNYLKKSYDAYSEMFSGAINALQEAELANIDAKYDAEIQRAGDNSEEVTRLEKEKENKKLAVQKKYANVNFAIKVSEIIANTAVAIMQAFGQLGPIGGAIAAAMLTATGAAQIATANAERKKVMAMTVDGAGSSGSGTGTRVATGKESGGYIDVTREQDGKTFNAEVDPEKRGFVDRPTVIVGEGPTGQSMEWVASNEALQNPTVAPIINLLNESQEKGEIRTVDMNQLMRKRLAGFESGGYPSIPATADTKVSANITPANSIVGTEVITKLYDLLQKIDKEGGLKAFIIYSELQKQQELLNESRKIGSKS